MADDLDALGNAIAFAVLTAIWNACAERDCYSEPTVECPCRIANAEPVAGPLAGPLAVPCADPECGFIAYH